MNHGARAPVLSRKTWLPLTAGPADQRGMNPVKYISGAALLALAASSGPGQIVIPENASENFGIALHAMGDVDGDGWEDFLAGDSRAPLTVGATTYDAGAAFVCSGRTQEVLARIDPPPPAGVSMEWRSSFGNSVSSIATTATASGRAAVVGAPYYDSALAFLANGLVLVADPEDGSELFRIDHPADLLNQAFGWSVAGISDLTGDGIGDILVGNYPLSGSLPGKVWIHSGANGALIGTIESPVAAAGAIAFGYSVSAIPDITGDGIADIAAGSHLAQSGEKRGLVHLFNGQTRQFLRTITFPMTTTGATAEAVDFGGRILGIPDLTGDSLGDLLVTAPRATRVNPSTLQVQTGLVMLFDGESGSLEEWFWNPSLPADPERLDTAGGSIDYLPQGLDGGEPLIFAGGTNFNQQWESDLGGSVAFTATNRFVAGSVVKPSGVNRLGLGYDLALVDRPGGNPALAIGQPGTEGRVFLLNAKTGEPLAPVTGPLSDIWMMTGPSGR